MAVEKRQALHRRRHIYLDLFEALHKDDILQNSGRGLAVHLRQLEAVTVQVYRMSIICLIGLYTVVRLVITIMAAVSQWEREAIGERTRAPPTRPCRSAPLRTTPCRG